MTNSVTIVGCLQGASCDHCGRPLKYGVQTDRLGTMGADCLNAMTVFDRKKFSQGRPGAQWIRELAMAAERGNRNALPKNCFVMECKEVAA